MTFPGYSNWGNSGQWLSMNPVDYLLQFYSAAGEEPTTDVDYTGGGRQI